MSSHPEKAPKFFGEVFKETGDDPKILFCFFAQKREDWEEKFEKYKKGFIENIDEKIRPTFELAFPNKFVDQLKNCDVLFIQGGDDHLLQYWLKQFDVPNIWKDKVVATSSAGSNALVKHFWTCDWRECLDGIGMLPIKFIPHYNSTEYAKDDPKGPIDWEGAYSELAEYGDKSLPIYAPEEGDFVVFEI